jgi:hypothetical protein
VVLMLLLILVAAEEVSFKYANAAVAPTAPSNVVMPAPAMVKPCAPAVSALRVLAN